MPRAPPRPDRPFFLLSVFTPKEPPVIEASITNPITGEIMCAYAGSYARAMRRLSNAIADAYDTDEAAMMQDQPVSFRELSETEAAEITQLLAI